MYVVKYSDNPNKEEVNKFINENGFGILVSQQDGKLVGTHIPMLLTANGKKISGHVAKANPHWKSFNSGEEVLAIFSGPHTYVSSSWYDHENVPTWNYVAVHVYGSIRIIEGEELVSSLSELVDKYEKTSEHPVSVKTMSTEYFNKEIKGLVGFEIEITRVEAAYKLSQNRDKKNYKEIIHQLEKRNIGDDQEIAKLMKQNTAKYTDL